MSYQEVRIKTAKLFRNGRSQAVRLPQEFRFAGSEVSIKQVPGGVLLSERDPWELFDEGVKALSDDFMAERTQPPLEDRQI